MRRVIPPFTVKSTMIMGFILFVWITIADAKDEPLLIRADSQYRYAQSLYDSGAFDAAINEFGRFIHFFADDPRILKAKYIVGMAHFKAGRYPDAARIFKTISENERAAGLRSEAFFMLSRAHARQGMIEQAMVDLHKLITTSPQPDIIDRARYELGWLYVDLGQWEPAKQSFNQIGPNHQARYQVDELSAALSDHDRIPVKHPLTAGLLSIVPGGGQVYCGRYQDALAAFLINAGLILSAWEAFDNDLYALGGVISFVEFGFYSGNIYGAVSSAHKFNREHAGAFRNDLYRRKLPFLSISAAASSITLGLTIDF